MKPLRWVLMWMLLCAAMNAHAAARAWLDRDHIAVGDSVTLTIESDGSPGRPNLAALQKDFTIGSVATGSQTTIVNGSMHSSMQWSVALVPRHKGVIDIPAIAVGNDRTVPLRVGVDAAPPAAAASTASTPSDLPGARVGQGGDPVFIESSIAPLQPYVQQSTIYTVRLYYAVPLLDGSLDVPNPEHGDLRQIGEDERDSVMVQGHRYDVLQRHYLLQPERSGVLHVPAPVFQGRSVPDLSGAFDDSMNSGELRTAGKPVDLQVRPLPTQAGDPWVPADALQLSLDPASTPPRAGEPFSIVVHLSGAGIAAAQLPEIALPAIADAQVYPEPSSTIEHARDGNLQAERTRRFVIVPQQPGTLKLAPIAVAWWDLVHDRAQTAQLAMPALQVLPGAAGGAQATGAQPLQTGPVPPATEPSPAGDLRPWQIATLLLAILLIAALAWGWRRGQSPAVSTDDEEATPARAASRVPTLTRALAIGDPDTIAQALRDATPGASARHLDEVAQRLDNPAQRDAVLALEASRWRAGGTRFEQVLAGLRAAFAQPPQWRNSQRARKSSGSAELPPLYPE